MHCKDWIDTRKKCYKWVHLKNDIKVQYLYNNPMYVLFNFWSSKFSLEFFPQTCLLSWIDKWFWRILSHTKAAYSDLLQQKMTKFKWDTQEKLKFKIKFFRAVFLKGHRMGSIHCYKQVTQGSGVYFSLKIIYCFSTYQYIFKGIAAMPLLHYSYKFKKQQDKINTQ